MELVIDFERKYKSDIFFYTKVNVVLIQIIFTITFLVLTLVVIILFYNDIVYNLTTSILEALSSLEGNIDSQSVTYNLEYVRAKYFIIVQSVILAIAALFGFLMMHFALVPTRKALDSQRKFIGNIAHELRTPLSIMKTNNEVMLFNQNLSKETIEAIKTNIDEINRIAEITDNLLSMSSIERPERMKFGKVNAEEEIERAIDSLKNLSANKKVSVKFQTHSQKSFIWANQSGFQQIIMNILKNSIRYNRPGGSVEITVNPDLFGQVEITIKDNGLGIARKDLPHIFEPFYHGEHSRNRKKSGSGLGLAIVAELIKIHKGQISIQSSQGHGTTVKIRVPSDTTSNLSEEKNSQNISVDYSKDE